MVGNEDTLSVRELEVARAYANGQSYKEISRGLGIAPATVRAHVRTIYQKLGVTTKISLARALFARHHLDQSNPVSLDDPGTAHTVRIAISVEAERRTSETSASLALGLTEDLIFELTRFRRMIVLSSKSSAEILERPAGDGFLQRGTDYAVRGKLRQDRERIRVTLSLESVQDGQSIWADRFDSDVGDFFVMKNHAVGRIAATILGRTEAAISFRVARRQPTSLAAYECVMRGKSLDIGDPALEAQRKELFSRAVELDPQYALAHALLAHSILLEWDRDLEADDRFLDAALASAKRAVSIDPFDPYCQFVVGFTHMFRQSFDVAEGFYRRVGELSPNDAELVAEIALFKAYAGESQNALDHLKRARWLDPNFEQSWLWHVEGIARFVDGQYAGAVTAFERSATSPLWVLAYQAAASALEGHLGAARRFASMVVELRPTFRSGRFADREPLRRSEDRESLMAGLLKAGLPA